MPDSLIRPVDFNADAGSGMELVVMLDDQVIDRHKLNGKRTTIGRSPDSDVCIESQYLSWKHSVIDVDSAGPFIVDLRSTNRTVVNGKVTQKTLLKDGDVISLGDHHIVFVQPGETVAAANGKHNPVADAAEEYVEPGRRHKSIDTSVDEFRAFSDAFAEDPEMVIADLYTKEIAENDSGMAYMPPVAPDLHDSRADADGNASRFTECAGEVSLERIEAVVTEAAADARDTMQVLQEHFAGDAATLTTLLGRVFNYRTLTTHQLMELAPDFRTLGLTDCRERQCLLLQEAGSQLAVLCDPFDQDLRPWLESRVAGALQWVLVAPGDLQAFIARHEQSMRAMDSAVQGADTGADPDSELEDLSLAAISQHSSPVIKLVHSTLYDALQAGASDIHMEAGVAALDIRYRIDGVLVHVASVSGEDIAEQVISRVKVMSELDIAERRIPQDGRFKSAYTGRPIDFRVSIMPSSFGEDAVLRVLDKQAVTDEMTELRLDGLGFQDGMVTSLRQLSERPYGMLLVTGPTGSGKTTTLYAAISETNSGLEKIVTIEDPVEYQLPGVLQIPVNEKKGLTFVRGLRSILRHDPDKIMVGEIRDPETAQIAVQSALTGHLVFTTVHANNVFDVLSRFMHMGVDPYSFVSALNGVLAQRLLRIVCQNCAESVTPSTEMLEATGEPLDEARAYTWRAGHGCSECRGTGYKGRRAIGELLVLNDELREAIIGRAPVRRLKELARSAGVQFIRAAALDLVRQGMTTIEEVNRVTTMA